jgi:hypothetical protein
MGVTMQAFEFNSIIEKGFVRIPERYANRITSPVKVIILAEDHPRPSRKKQFAAMSLDTRGFKFDRDEANER